MREIVRNIELPGGELLPALVEPGRGPVLDTLRYALCVLRNAGRAESTIDKHMRAIALAREWARSNGFTLESRMARGVGLNEREIEGLSNALKLGRASLGADKPERSNVLPFARSDKPPRMPNPETGANQVRAVAGYLDWLARQSEATDSQHRLRDTVKSLSIRAKISIRPQSTPKKGLSDEQRELLLAVIDPSSPDNPFKSEAVRHRNLAVVACLDDTGMRKGELAGLQIPDIDFRQLTISIHRRPPDPDDPRRERPKTKTNARTVPIKLDLADLLRHYISVWRHAEPGARRHGYVFVSHKGASAGVPLGTRAMGKIFQTLQDVLGFDLHPHLLRHTWNGRFSDSIDRNAQRSQPAPLASEERIRNYLMGWQPGSKMVELYSQRHIERAAHDLMRQMNEESRDE